MEYQTTGEKRFGLGELPPNAVNYVGGAKAPQRTETSANPRTYEDESRNPREGVKSSRAA